MVNLILIIAVMVISNVIAYTIGKEKQRIKERNKRRAAREIKYKAERDGEDGLTADEIAAKRINEALPIDTVVRHKEFKLATLTVVDKDDYPTIEDYFLINDEGKRYELSYFREDDRNVDWILSSFKCLDSICANVYHEVVDNVARYSAFDETLNNCYGGRHGKSKIDVKDAFITFVDLTREELRIIATHEDDDIYMKEFNSQVAIEHTANMRRHRDYRKNLTRVVEREEMEDMIKDIENRVNELNLIENIDGYLSIIKSMQGEYALPSSTEDEIDLTDVKTFYHESYLNDIKTFNADTVEPEIDLTDIKTFYVVNEDIVKPDIELIDYIGSNQIEVIDIEPKDITVETEFERSITLKEIIMENSKDGKVTPFYAAVYKPSNDRKKNKSKSKK